MLHGKSSQVLISQILKNLMFMILSYSWFRVTAIYLVKTTTQILFSGKWWEKKMTLCNFILYSAKKQNERRAVGYLLLSFCLLTLLNRGYQ